MTHFWLASLERFSALAEVYNQADTGGELEARSFFLLDLELLLNPVNWPYMQKL